MPEEMTISIDGEAVSCREGQTLLDVARASGLHVPTLCHLEGLSDVGACRLCLVEVGSSGRLVPACTTPVQDGMEVTLASDRVRRYRRMILELVFSERNHVCAVCVANGHCELQALAGELGITHVRYAYRYPRLPVDASHERFVVDHNRCILCTRCIRACDEVEGAHVWDLAFRGIAAMVVSECRTAWGEATACTSCGKCVRACPTGALAEKGFAVEELADHAAGGFALPTPREAQR